MTSVIITICLASNSLDFFISIVFSKQNTCCIVSCSMKKCSLCWTFSFLMFMDYESSSCLITWMHVNMKLNKAVVAGKYVIALYPAYSWLVVKKHRSWKFGKKKKSLSDLYFFTLLLKLSWKVCQVSLLVPKVIYYEQQMQYNYRSLSTSFVSLDTVYSSASNIFFK